MEKIQHFIGADLAKKSIDLCCYGTKSQLHIANSLAGFKKLLQWLTQHQISADKVIIVMEHTGLYGRQLEKFLHEHKIALVKVNALAIKRSMGLVRGKTDQLDAARIACYAYRNREELQQQRPPDGKVERLQLLQSTRDRLVRQRTGLLCAVEEYKNINIGSKDLLIKAQQQVIKTLNSQIENLEQEINEVINSSDELKGNFRLLTSIKGVGPVVAVAALIKTHNFTRFANARKFACYCGTAPFEHSSGSSIRGRTRVSHLADKSMKTLLDLAAKSAIQCDPEMKEFYARRLENGKSKMSTINIVRNKILFRMFAVIKRQTPFIPDYKQAA